jgi:hypothetical protein
MNITAPQSAPKRINQESNLGQHITSVPHFHYAIDPNSLLKNAVVAFFNLAKRQAKLVAARKTATCVAVLTSHPCDDAAR